ncbi:hypothetical protein [Ehrlichia canis]|uniref:hypothetical protein n=1 Tax=Ehrlichia canis TaxID=944 RepID=UPI000C819156|nr:hypothetical protein [Ehrlichia canis]AUO54371.1 hypothetical protein C1I72_00370 [Ehrlichia canis]UKC53861.1 hypothetical protein s20019040002_000906 [Ehrlichia canis]UKC54797.1 hypothetical protein s20026770001_000905 [Ehrlichia canis]UKC55733.1 hypothetical protein s21009500007_000905 [Ehrlichia canis]
MSGSIVPIPLCSSLSNGAAAPNSPMLISSTNLTSCSSAPSKLCSTMPSFLDASPSFSESSGKIPSVA